MPERGQTSATDAPKRARASSGRQRERDGCRRRIEPAEVPLLHTLGTELRSLRRTAGLTQRELAEGACLTRSHVERIEAGVRRTRRSTLERMAATLTVAEPDPEHLADALAELAGPALAPESEYAERVARRRERRERRKRNREAAKRGAKDRARISELLRNLGRLAGADPYANYGGYRD
jgi:transcriptional regulator with XRE-family HTH domain